MDYQIKFVGTRHSSIRHLSCPGASPETKPETAPEMTPKRRRKRRRNRKRNRKRRPKRRPKRRRKRRRKQGASNAGTSPPRQSGNFGQMVAGQKPDYAILTPTIRFSFLWENYGEETHGPLVSRPGLFANAILEPLRGVSRGESE